MADILRAHMGDPERLRQVLGREVHPKALLWEPQGARMLVALDEDDTQVEGTNIVVPDGAGTPSTGVVIAAGPFVGEKGQWPYGAVGSPEAFLYKRIVFGKGAHDVWMLDLPYYRPRGEGGVVLPVADKIMVMTSRSILNIVWDDDE